VNVGQTGSYFDAPPRWTIDVPNEILEFFQPEAEEHLQIVADCLLSLEGNNNPEEINRLFRAIHTVKGSAAQVWFCGDWAAFAHRVEDLIGRFARRRDSAFAIRGGPLPGIRGTC